MRTRYLAAAAISWMALLLSSPIVPAQAQTVRVEGENYLAPPASGPNVTDVVSTYQPGNFTDIEFFVSWDYVEWDANIPEDGTYSITFHYASDWALDNGLIPEVITFWTSGQQVTPTIPFTREGSINGWGNFKETTFDKDVPLKAGPNRFRIQIRPDNANNNYFGTGMNLDWIEFRKVGAYPALETITGTVTATVGGAAQPLEGAIVSVGEQYTEAQYITRTGSDGKYTLHVPAGAQSVTAFYNGFAKATASVTAPGTHDFALDYSGKFEAELFQATNPGPGDNTGYQPAYNTARSNNGILWTGRDGGEPRKWAEWRNVVVPTAGVYELSMNYASWKINTDVGYGRFLWSANGGPPTELRFAQTFTDPEADKYQDSGTVLLDLKQGLNTIRLYNPSNASLATVDTFTLTPTTKPYGTVKAVVTNQANGQPILGASVILASNDTTVNGISYSGATGADGSATFYPVPVGAYTVTANTAVATAPASASVAVAANQTATANLTLSLTAIAVEAENYTAAGPGVPPAMTFQVADDPAASGGKTVNGFAGINNGGGRIQWLEWTVDAPEDGLYDVSINYSTVVSTVEVLMNFWDTTYQLYVDRLPYAAGYQDFMFANQVPLRKGLNTFRLTVRAGSINLDFVKFHKSGALPALATITGVVKGTDGTGTAPIRNAAVYADGDILNAEFATRTDATGAYTLYLPAGSHSVGASAPGYTPLDPSTADTGTPKDMTLNTNNGAGMKVEAESSPSMYWELQATDVITISGPPKWFDLDVSAPRSGLYQVGMRYSSDWSSDDEPGFVKTVWTINGVDFAVKFPKPEGGGWGNYVVADNVTTIPQNAGPNTIRITWVGGGSNFDYFTFARTGNLPVLTTDIDGNGKTDIMDALVYVRRLRGTDTGATPDVDGNGIANAQDVQRILKVAGGLS